MCMCVCKQVAKITILLYEKRGKKIKKKYILYSIQ